MTIDYDLEKLEESERKWANEFARRRGWEEHYLNEPEAALELFFSHIPGTSMLDTGCGWGRYVYRFVEAGLDYTGLDHSREMLAVASATNPGLKFLEGTFRKMPFADNSFDGVWSCCSLSTIPKPHIVSVLEEHRRVLKSGGVMLLAMPSLLHSDERVYREDGCAEGIFYAHYFYEEFLGYLAKTQFSTLDSEDHYHTSGSMWFLMRK